MPGWLTRVLGKERIAEAALVMFTLSVLALVLMNV